MKKLLLLLAFLPTMLSAQNSWVRFKVQYDYYAPQESNFTFVANSNGDTLLYHVPTQTYEYLDTLIYCNSGGYLVSLYDSFGDGWQSVSSGQLDPVYFKITNQCQGEILNFDPLTTQFSVLDTLVNIQPCAPPVVGCMDPNSLTYDPLAIINDPSQCTYPPCGGLLSSNAYNVCINDGTQSLIIFEWVLDETNPNCEIASVIIWNENGLGPFNFSPAPVPNFSFPAGNGQMPPNWSVEHYCQLEFANGSLSDTIFFTPSPCIPGCTDPTQESYNPWATSDDGSCAGTTCDPSTEYQITMEITFDNWPGETSWIMNSAGVIGSASYGEYDFNDIGQTYTYTFCVDQSAGFELILNDSYGDGMAGSTSGGTLDGSCVIYSCEGDTLWSMDDPNFNNTLYSGIQLATPCETTPDILGCTNSDYQEYNPLANVDDSSCVNLHVYGCTDSTSFNYDPLATINEIIPTCDYTLWIGDAAADGWGNSYIGVYQDGASLGTFTMGPGSYEQTFPLTLDTDKPVKVYYFEVGGPQQPPQEVQFQTWHNSFKLINADGVELLYEGSNPFANNGQGALQSFKSPFFTTYSATPYCGDYCIPKVFGCMDSTSFNYNSLANTDDGSCIPVVFGCTNDLAFNYDPNANTDDGSCQSIITGCMDINADNYNPSANTDDGSCYYIGCTDVTALNYDSTATVNSGCIYPIPGCTDPTSFNYDPLANVDDGSCVDIVYGCMDITSFNYNPLANIDNGSCIPVIFGCIDSTALNYDPLANTDNGTCILPVVGCTDPSAANYNPLANVTDSTSCLYDAGCYQGEGLPYWLNDGCFAWVIDVDEYCCSTDWDASCQSMYNYCENGWPAGLNDMDALGIIAYPNPTNDKLFIDTHLDIEVQLLDMMGKEVSIVDEKGSNTIRIDLNKLSPGAYNLVIKHNEKRYTKRVIRQ